MIAPPPLSKCIGLTLEAGLPWVKVRHGRILIQTNVCSLLAKVTDRKAKSIKSIYPSIYSVLASDSWDGLLLYFFFLFFSLFGCWEQNAASRKLSLVFCHLIRPLGTDLTTAFARLSRPNVVQWFKGYTVM